MYLLVPTTPKAKEILNGWFEDQAGARLSEAVDAEIKRIFLHSMKREPEYIRDWTAKDLVFDGTGQFILRSVVKFTIFRRFFESIRRIWSLLNNATEYSPDLPFERGKETIRRLGIAPRDSLIDVGAGEFGGIGLIAALQGAIVTAVESKTAAVRSIEGRYKTLKSLIHAAGGSFELIHGDFTSDEVQKKLANRKFKHVIATDLITPSPIMTEYSKKAPPTSDPRKIQVIFKFLAQMKSQRLEGMFLFSVPEFVNLDYRISDRVPFLGQTISNMTSIAEMAPVSSTFVSVPYSDGIKRAVLYKLVPTSQLTGQVRQPSDGARLAVKEKALEERITLESGLPIDKEDELLFAIHVYDSTKKEGFFAITRKPEGVPDILGVRFNEKTGTLTVHLSDNKAVELKNYKAILQRNQKTKRLEKGALILSKNELTLADLNFELGRQTKGVKRISANFVSTTPKLLKLNLQGFMNENTKGTDSLFIDWLIHSMHEAKKKGALLILEKGTDSQTADILDRASVLYPTERLIFPNKETLPESHKNANSVTIVAVDPEKVPSLEDKGELHLIAKTLDKNNLHNVTALIQTALVEAEIGLEGIKDASNLKRLRDIYQVLGVEVKAEEISAFTDFLEGIGLTSENIKRWAIGPFKIDEILRAYALGARMASQAA